MSEAGELCEEMFEEMKIFKFININKKKFLIFIKSLINSRILQPTQIKNVNPLHSDSKTKGTYSRVLPSARK